MIDIQTESLISLKDACRMIPGRSGKAINRATIWRWASRGRRGVTLETVLLGDRFTSVEAVGRFVARLNGTPESRDRRVCQDRGVELLEQTLIAEGF